MKPTTVRTIKALSLAESSRRAINSDAIEIQFSLANFVQIDGAGVYTIYLTQGDVNNPEYLTSISMFVSG